MKPKTINPNAIRVRDLLMVAVICGVTKTGIKPDRKKVESKRACRRPARPTKAHPPGEE